MPFITSSDKLWELLLAETPHDFYHLQGFAQIEAELLGGEALGWYSSEGENRYLIPLIKRPIGHHYLHDLASPYGYPGIVSNQQLSIEDAVTLLNRFHLDAKKEGFVSSFIRLNPISNDWDFNETTESQTLPFRQVFHGQTVSVNLKPSLKSIRQNFSENHKRNLKTLKHQGYQLDFNDWSYLGEFIEVYRQTMTRKSAYPYYFFPTGYFENLKEILGERLVFVTITDKDSRLVSGGLFTHFGKIMQYHLGATLTEAIEHSPSKMMMDESIAFGKKKGAEMMHVGGGFSANTSDGLFRFKKGFGSHLHPFSTLRFIHHPDIYEKLVQDKKRKNRDLSFFPEYRNL
jgi:hypothetical protein